MLNLDKTGNAGTGGETYFDHDGDGFAEHTTWAGRNEGLLVLDRNGNGQIDDGNELFGDYTILSNGRNAVDGFRALAELDENKDGVIDARDSAWSELRVWTEVPIFF